MTTRFRLRGIPAESLLEEVRRQRQRTLPPPWIVDFVEDSSIQEPIDSADAVPPLRKDRLAIDTEMKGILMDLHASGNPFISASLLRRAMEDEETDIVILPENYFEHFSRNKMLFIYPDWQKRRYSGEYQRVPGTTDHFVRVTDRARVESSTVKESELIRRIGYSSGQHRIFVKDLKECLIGGRIHQLMLNGMLTGSLMENERIISLTMEFYDPEIDYTIVSLNESNQFDHFFSTPEEIEAKDNQEVLASYARTLSAATGYSEIKGEKELFQVFEVVDCEDCGEPTVYGEALTLKASLEQLKDRGLEHFPVTPAPGEDWEGEDEEGSHREAYLCQVCERDRSGG